MSLAAALAAGIVAAACGGGGAGRTNTPPAMTADLPATVATTPARPATDPCTTRTGADGRPPAAAVSFALDASTEWQSCKGGGAAGSGEKFLFRTNDGRRTWALVSRTTLGNPPPEPGVGTLPNAGGVTQLVFVDVTYGWLGLDGPGRNLYRSTDGGVTWAAAREIPAGVPITSITFSSETRGAVTTSDATTWITSDRGETWKKAD